MSREKTKRKEPCNFKAWGKKDIIAYETDGKSVVAV